MTTTRDKLRDSIEQILLLTWGDIVAQIEQIDPKALDLLSLEQKMHLHELMIEAAGRCTNFAAAYYCDGGDMLTVMGSIEKVAFQPGKGVSIVVSTLNTPDNIISLAEMGSGVSIHGIQTVIPNTVVNAETVSEAMENEAQMDLEEGADEPSENEESPSDSDDLYDGEADAKDYESTPPRRGRPRKAR